MREVIRTVSQFHANGIVLRDVKPENWMFSDTERTAQLKAIDFGIAEYCGPEDTLQERAGTPIYVAPGALPPFPISHPINSCVHLQGDTVRVTLTG